jgi:hypothetical protein
MQQKMPPRHNRFLCDAVGWRDLPSMSSSTTRGQQKDKGGKNRVAHKNSVSVRFAGAPTDHDSIAL